MLSSEGNAREWWKNNNRSNWQKSKFARAAHFFSTFLCSCFAQLQCETFRNFLVIRFMEEILYMFLFTFFSPSLILNSFFHCCYKISCFPQEKMSPLFFLSRSSSLSLWDSLACRATFSFSISKIVDMTTLITLSLKL